VDLEMGEGEFTVIVGRSGSGKTSLLNIVGGLDSRYDGQVEVAGRELKGLGDRALSRIRSATIGFVFQAYHLLDHLTVAENVALPLLFAPSGRRIGHREQEARVAEVLGSVGMAARAADRPAGLSGGERQRVAVARAVSLSPRILLCDEPTGNLDPHTGAEIVALLRRLHEAGLATVLVATHDEAITRSAGRVLELRRGRLEDWGGPRGSVA
jgi:putative ABC transport system ATP-binding protein